MTTLQMFVQASISVASPFHVFEKGDPDAAFVALLRAKALLETACR